MPQGATRSPTHADPANLARMMTAGYSEDPLWARYDALNAVVAEEVFGEQAAGRPVYLDLDHDALTRIAGDLGFRDKATPAEELVGIVKATLSSPDSDTGTFEVHASRAWWWGLQESTMAPPCVALLAVLSLVAERMKQTEEFAGTNYYGRLLQTLDIDEAHRDPVIRSFRKETPFLWNTLNRWLEECNGRRGLPTAVAFDRLRYIGLPLSQALVREQDRAKLPMLFTQFGLQHGQRVSVQAMQELLAHWLPRSPVTQSLKRLWSKPVTRERISEIACAEMEAWDGQLPDEFRSAEVRRDDDLLLAAEVRSHPRRSIELILVARHTSRERPRRAVLHPDATSAARTAFARLGDAMRLDRIPGTSWASVEPSHLVSCSVLLVADVLLALGETDITCARRAKRLVLLKWREEDHLFVETRRAELLETYLVLAVHELADPVRGVLQSSAREGFGELTGTTLRGLPTGWTAFANVQLERIPSTDSDDLKPLQPIARTHLALGGGLPLPGMNVWHSDRLPELRIVIDEYAETHDVHVRAVPIRYLDDREPVDVQLGEVTGAGIVDLAGLPTLRDGDFRIVVAGPSGGRAVATAGLRARSGSWPRRLEPEEDALLGHPLLDGRCLAPFGSCIEDTGRAAGHAAGALIDVDGCLEVADRADILTPIPAQPGASIEVEDLGMSDWSPADATLEDTPGDLPDCFRRGYHHWRLDMQLGKEPVYSVCKDCGREKWWEPVRKHHKRRPAAAAPMDVDDAEVSRRPPLPSISERGKADMNLALDALSYARTGFWRSFQAVTATIDDAPWFPHEAARRLEALGHIELEMDDKTITPRRWSIAPSTIVVPEQGPCFLAGGRSARLLRTVAEVSRILDGEVRVTPQDEGPDVVEIHGLGSEAAELVVDEIKAQHRLPVALSVRPAGKLAALLPSLRTTRGLLPELTTTADRMDWLDLRSGRWTSVEQMDRAGAYRLRGRPWVYAVVPEAGTTGQRCVVADVRHVKHLAASDASHALIGYDVSTRTLLTPLGAPLPGLLERAAVLCSGRLPRRRPDRTLAYERVPPAVAEAIWAAATAGD